jgi:hypothetical protein
MSSLSRLWANARGNITSVDAALDLYNNITDYDAIFLIDRVIQEEDLYVSSSAPTVGAQAFLMD